MRMIVNALDEKTIKKALVALRDNKDFFNLNQSALARSLYQPCKSWQVESYGYGPQAVLTGAQGLYEKKYTSYHRFDCNFIPES